MEEFKNKDLSVLAMDLSKVDEDVKYWNDRRLKKGNIYHAFSEYIVCLEKSIEYEEDSYKKFLLQKELKKMREEQRKYYVPSVLEMATNGVKKSKGLTEFVKKLKK